MEDCDAGIYIEGAASHPDHKISEAACALFELYNFYYENFGENEFIIDFDSFEKPQDVQMNTDIQQ